MFKTKCTTPGSDASESRLLLPAFLNRSIIELDRVKRSRSTSSEGLSGSSVKLGRHQVPEPRAFRVNLAWTASSVLKFGAPGTYVTRCKMGTRLTSCLYVPLSTICPSSSTTMRSARAIVDSRCATTRHVVCLDRRILSIASLTRCSDVASSELVASSRARIAGFFSSARAIASRWRCPPEREERPTVRAERPSVLKWGGNGSGAHSRCRSRAACPTQTRSLPRARPPRSAPSSRQGSRTRCSTRSCP